MALSEYHIDLVQRALDNDLSEAEKVAFDKELKNSIELKEEHERQLNLLGHLEAHRKQKIKKELKDLYVDFRQNKLSRSKQIPFFKYGIAASVLIILSTIFWVVNRTPKSSLELYHEYYEPFHGGPLMRGEEEDSVQMALSAYYLEDYQKALHLFSKLGHPKKDLLIANCYLNLERYNEAEEALKTAITVEGNQEAATWYLALLYLKQGKNNKAKKVLSQLKKGYYYSEAVEILDAMD